MANIGDKYVIEIDSKMTNKNGTLYGIKGFKSLVFDEEGLRMLKKVGDEWKAGDIVIDHSNGRLGIVFSSNGEGFQAIWDDGCRMYRSDGCAVVGNVWDIIKREDDYAVMLD